MKKMTVIIVTLALALIFANSAYALLTETTGVQVTSNSSMIDVQIVQRTLSTSSASNINSSTSNSQANQAKETINNIAPGDEITLEYKIINTGSMDALLSGVDVIMDSQEFSEMIVLKWTITKYVDATSVSTSTSNQKNELIDVADAKIILDNNYETDDYCILQIVIGIDDTISVPFNSIRQSVFTVTPIFIQS